MKASVAFDPTALRQLKALGLSDRRAAQLLGEARKANRLRTPAARFAALGKLVRKVRAS